jgi:tight adherence protein B
VSASVLAAGSAALAMALSVRPPPRPASGLRAASSRGWIVPAVLGAGVTATVVSPRFGVLLVVLGAAGAVGVALLRRQRGRRAAAGISARVLETCEAMASELAGGQAPGECLDRAAAAWPLLAPVAAAFRVGADVPTAMRELAAEVDGAGDLRVVAAAWQVAHRTGEGLAATIDRVAESLRAAAGTRRVVAGELASARATARLVAGLPVLALVMGSGAGGDPWGFLLGTPPGLACLALGLAFGFAGLWWIEAIARGAEEVA